MRKKNQCGNSPQSRCRFANPINRIASALVFLVLPSRAAFADEAGVSFWVPGQYASFAAVPLKPGLYLPTQFYFYGGSGGKTETFQRGNSVNAGFSTQAYLLFLTPTWVPDVKWLGGGQPSISMTVGGGWNAASTDLSVSTEIAGSQTIDRSDSIFGAMDLYPQAQMAWSSGNDNGMAYVTADIPVGAYSSHRLANLGLGHSAFDAGGAYTYLNDKTGLEVSALLGFTYNLTNPSANYRNGLDSHLDWDVSHFVTEQWQLGIVGYFYYQLTGDSGSGDHVGSFRSRVASVGAEVGNAFKLGGLSWYANARGYWEFAAAHRPKGAAAFATLSIPFGNP